MTVSGQATPEALEVSSPPGHKVCSVPSPQGESSSLVTLRFKNHDICNSQNMLFTFSGYQNTEWIVEKGSVITSMASR